MGAAAPCRGALRGAVALEPSWEHGSTAIGVHGTGSRWRLPVGPAARCGACFPLRGGAAPRAAKSSVTHRGFISLFLFIRNMNKDWGSVIACELWGSGEHWLHSAAVPVRGWSHLINRGGAGGSRRWLQRPHGARAPLSRPPRPARARRLPAFEGVQPISAAHAQPAPHPPEGAEARPWGSRGRGGGSAGLCSAVISDSLSDQFLPAGLPANGRCYFSCTFPIPFYTFSLVYIGQSKWGCSRNKDELKRWMLLYIWRTGSLGAKENCTRNVRPFALFWIATQPQAEGQQSVGDLLCL